MKTLSAQSSSLYIKLAFLIRKGHTSVITGAGISTSGGIPDFRSSTGIFKDIKNKHGYNGEQIFTFGVVHSCDKAFQIFIQLICSLKDKVEQVQPTPTHRMLAYIQKRYKFSLYTQNIDGIEKKAGIEKDLIYLHGNLETLICSHCHHHVEYTLDQNQLLQSKTIIECPNCIQRKTERQKLNKRPTPIGKLMPNIVLYGDKTEEMSLLKRVHYDQQTDVLLVMGTSLKVYGVKNLVKEISRQASKNNGVKVYIGREAPPKIMQPFFDYWIEGDCDTFSSVLLETLQGKHLLKELQKASQNRYEELLASFRRLSLDTSFRTNHTK
ncbi:NAD+-dependent protein deacetylase SIR2 [Nematocida homosporus]|uniref:NAD+-dependent protein deacetylase SIR2 n=1 Tax=Nematocida homosporus TaxID=1912981 RepID=UPI002220D44E|nr:NAD+-dependent protein deacetylase SIR2 [Nematocida homosporus]KAI5185720.1 NAD+-dependent protein deacetylase SIR2 [Nematocida homosporus]